MVLIEYPSTGNRDDLTLAPRDVLRVRSAWAFWFHIEASKEGEVLFACLTASICTLAIVNHANCVLCVAPAKHFAELLFGCKTALT